MLVQKPVKFSYLYKCFCLGSDCCIAVKYLKHSQKHDITTTTSPPFIHTICTIVNFNSLQLDLNVNSSYHLNLSYRRPGEDSGGGLVAIKI